MNEAKHPFRPLFLPLPVRIELKEGHTKGLQKHWVAGWESLGHFKVRDFGVSAEKNLNSL